MKCRRLAPGESETMVGKALAGLRRFGTDDIDLYQIHRFDQLTSLEDTLRALDDLVRAGEVRYIGCSNLAALAGDDSAYDLAPRPRASGVEGCAARGSLSGRGAMLKDTVTQSPKNDASDSTRIPASRAVRHVRSRCVES